MPEKIQQYTISDRIATGGTGIVRRGRDTDSKTDVAVKSLNPDLVREPQTRKRLKEAKKALQSIPPQENLVRVLDMVESGDTMHIIMEYAPGRSLEGVLSKKSRPMPQQSAVQLLNQALKGAVAAHSKGVLHGNLKPSDILIGNDNLVRVSGFGIAQNLSAGVLLRTAARTGKIMYMPPEQVRGENIDERADVYSLGVILYRMITGKMPFIVSDRDSESRLRQAILQQQAPDIAETMPDLNIPPYLSNIVRRALAKDRRERIPTTREFARLLQKVQQEMKSEAVAPISPDTAVAGKTAQAATLLGAAALGVAAMPNPKPSASGAVLSTSPTDESAQTSSSTSAIAPATEKTFLSQEPAQEKSGLSALFSKKNEASAPQSTAPTVFTTPTLTKTPMQLEVERRMQAVRAEQQERSTQEASAQSQWGTQNTANPTDEPFTTTAPALSTNRPPSPETLKTQLTPTEPIKPASKNEEKKKRAVLPWLIIGAVALGGGIYYVALKNKDAENASSTAKNELSKEEQERRYDSLLTKSDKTAEQAPITDTTQQGLSENTDAARAADTAQMSAPTSSTNTAPTLAPTTSEEKPRIPPSTEENRLLDRQIKSENTSKRESGKQDPINEAAKKSEAEKKSVGAKSSAAKTETSTPLENQAAKSRSSRRTNADAPKVPSSVPAAPTIQRSVQAKAEKSSVKRSTEKAPKTTNAAANTSATPAPSIRPSIRKSEARTPDAAKTPKSGSLAEANAEANAERDAARERVRKKYADHLRRKGTAAAPSTIAANTPKASTEEPSAKATPDALKDMNKKAPRTNRTDNYAPATNPVESPDTIDPKANELTTALRKSKGVEPFLILRGHVGNVRSVSFSPDGKTIASGSDDKTVKIWDAATGTILRSLRGHSATVTSVFFSPDGKTLISSGKDKTVRVWDAATGEALQSSAGVSCEGTPAAFSPDGKFLATSDKRNINISKAQR